jgi:serine/threonine-protein kinase
MPTSYLPADEARTETDAAEAVPPSAVEDQLERILASDTFARSERMSRFLRFTVQQALAGKADSLKEYLIGVEVYDKPETLDPRFDPIVRVEAGRLRSKLREYYESEGGNDPVLISFRKRSYAPVFRFRFSNASPSSWADRRAPVSGAVQSLRHSSIAVLPFADMSRRGDQDYFCDGLTEELINALAHVDGVRVVARTSVFQFKGEARDIRHIGAQLKVNAILEGSVRKSGQRLRITAQLNDALDGCHLWSETFDREMKDVFRLQQELSHAIAQRVRVADPSRSLQELGQQPVKMMHPILALDREPALRVMPRLQTALD